MDDFLVSCPSPNYSEENQIFSALFQVLVAATCNLTRQNVWPEDYGPKLLTESKRFDYIIVGAGSAGATIAGRLSEDPNINVLLIEAGGDPPLFTVIPATYPSFQKTKYDWEHYAEPSTTHSFEAINGRPYIPQGKMLGGCSSINAMAYVRGNRRDYDRWEAKGNTGWGYDNVLEYFKKTENLQAKELLESDQGKYHGTTGPMTINYFGGNLSSPLINAAMELGYDFKTDFNGEDAIGFFRNQANLGNGERSSPATAFLKKKKDNLFIVKNALVSKVLIDKVQKQATGVEYINSDGETISVNASREVIISAGAIKSPQLLMLSGIGPAKQLQKFKIPLIADLPVGLHLIDHLIISTIIELPDDTSKFVQSDYTDSLYNYLMHRTGPLAGEWDVMGLVNVMNKTETYPDIQLLTFFHKKNDIGLRNNIILSQSYLEDFMKSIEELNKKSSILGITSVLLKPQSAGEVKLRSADPLQKPIIIQNYLKSKRDIDVMLQSAKFVEKLVKTSAMRQVGARLFKPVLHRCNELEFPSDKYWLCYLRSLGKSGYHLTGTVKMGPRADKTAVVSPRLKVHGVKGLRVADASIMPEIVSGNTNAACIMIGEKAADMIKESIIIIVSNHINVFGRRV